MRRWALWLAWPALAAAAAPEGAGGVRVVDPRAFGYHVGDVFERRVHIDLPAGWRLDSASLPRPGGRGRPIELRSLVRHDAAGSVELVLRYQVLAAPETVRVLEVPPWRLRVEGAGRSEEWRVESVPVAVAPLVPPEVPAREGFGPWRPDRPAPPLDGQPIATRLAAWGLLGSVAALAWLAVEAWHRWAAARRRPFGHAWRQLRRLPAQPAPEQWRAALRQMHEALNRAAGQVLFEAGVPGFVAARRGYGALESELLRFLTLSRAEFFEGRGAPEGSAAWLKGLSRRLRDAERAGA